MKSYRLLHHIRSFGLAVVVNKLSVRVHKIHDNGVVNNIVVIIVGGTGAEVDTVGPSRLLHLVFCAGQPDQVGMKFFHILGNFLLR